MPTTWRRIHTYQVFCTSASLAMRIGGHGNVRSHDAGQSLGICSQLVPLKARHKHEFGICPTPRDTTWAEAARAEAQQVSQGSIVFWRVSTAAVCQTWKRRYDRGRNCRSAAAHDEAPEGCCVSGATYVSQASKQAWKEELTWHAISRILDCAR